MGEANGSMIFGFVLMPIFLLLAVGLFFFVWKMPKDLGIYLGWLPSLAFLLLVIFTSSNLGFWIFLLILSLIIYIIGTALRIDKNKKLKAREDQRLKEIDKMSINDL